MKTHGAMVGNATPEISNFLRCAIAHHGSLASRAPRQDSVSYPAPISGKASSRSKR